MSLFLFASNAAGELAVPFFFGRVYILFFNFYKECHVSFNLGSASQLMGFVVASVLGAATSHWEAGGSVEQCACMPKEMYIYVGLCSEFAQIK